MLYTKLVLRALDREDNLLGWVETQALAKGDGKLWLENSTKIPIDIEGKVFSISSHWCDVNIETRSVIDELEVKPGDSVTIPENSPIIICGPIPKGLPAVTLRGPNQIVNIPVGVLGASGASL